MLVLVAACGCGGSTPTPANPDQARAALTAGLEAWKNGDNQENLKNRSPAINMSDPDWRRGVKLDGYEIKSGSPQGSSFRYEVVLNINDAASGSQAQLARYTIDTQPALVVIRDEE